MNSSEWVARGVTFAGDVRLIFQLLLILGDERCVAAKPFLSQEHTRTMLFVPKPKHIKHMIRPHGVLQCIHLVVCASRDGHRFWFCKMATITITTSEAHF